MNACTIERRKVRTHSRLNLKTAERRELSSSVVIEPCDSPLFDEASRARGCCRSCAKGWAVEGNLPTRAGALAIAKATGQPAPLWTQTHPHEGVQPWPEIPPGWRDSSWHNDEVPKLAAIDDEGPLGELMLFCDAPDPADRLHECTRYSLGDTRESLFECEEWPDMRALLDDLATGRDIVAACAEHREKLASRVE